MEVLKEKIIHVQDLYKWADSLSDERVREWPLMSSPLPTLGLVAVYLTFVKVGPKVMENRAPFQLRIPLILYNLAVMLLNLYIGVELAIVSVRLRYSWFCQPVSYSKNPDEMRIAAALWWYYASKLIEFTDTVFFILRKKNNQLTFLHIYHHSTMFCLWWIGIKYVAGGSSFLAAMMNSFVHVVMYAYYGLAAFGPSVQKYLWWKKHITCIQLVQFGSAGVLGARAIVVGCDFPLWMQYALVVYMASFMFLFGQFYVQAYRRKLMTASIGSQEKKLKDGRNGNMRHQNGTNGVMSNGVSPSSKFAKGEQKKSDKSNGESKSHRTNVRTRAQSRREGRPRHDS
ncbi:very long chain fatty acid elongase 4-like isoform X1 [Penaeus indicus]|uniref:very long chain fatty acid elongase 4-like isoform X1 n=1 Tax=Penaeus indicus TaxID=29960 RepID=UPI00300BFC15